MTSHSQLSPSKRHRWAVCPGSIREEAKYPEEQSGPAAADGTHSHTLLEMCINDGLPAAEYCGHKLRDHEGSFIVTNDRAARVQVALDYIAQRKAEHIDNYEVLTETRVDPAHLVGRGDLSGTVDVHILGGELLELIDYKDGMAPVAAKDNMQLEQYAYGALAHYMQRPQYVPFKGAYPFSTVRMTIVQPKLAMKGMPPIVSHDVSVHDLMRGIGKIVTQAAATDDPNAPLVPGESQCKYCRAKGGCSALANDALKEVGVLFKPLATASLDMAQQGADKDPAVMSDDQLRQIMEAAPLMRQLLDGVETESLRRMKAGQSISGLKLVHGPGSRVWSLPEDQIATKLIKMGIPKTAVYETKLVSPAKAEKLTWEKRDGTKATLTKHQIERMGQEYVSKLAGKITVAYESDGRPAVITNAAPMFSAVEAPVVESLPSWLTL
jgi:hypothetical protein